MKCADPVLCYITATGQKIYRHFSLADSIVKRTAQLVFDCGKCLFCRKKRAYELASRCVLNASLYEHNSFLTLTYDEKKESYHNNFDYTDIQKFKKRLRRHCGKKRIQIFNVHEYGKLGKKHWHLVVFNHDFTEDRTIHSRANGLPLYTSARLGTLWPHGFNTIGDITAASAMYTAQYQQKDIKNGNTQNAKKSHSKHAGIGRSYFLKHYKQILSLGYVPINGKKLPVPRYFQRLAHKHYCHFYEISAFRDIRQRKALYRPFKPGEPRSDIAQLYIQYKQIKQERLKEIELEWSEFLEDHLTSKTTPDFIKSHSNAIYDLNKNTTIERF